MELRALEQIVQNLHARDIAAFPVVCAGVDDDISTVRKRMESDDFSHMPLRDANGRVVCVLEHNAALGKTGRACDAAVPLDSEKHVINASEPLPMAIERLPKAGFLLVKSRESGHRDLISGIINHADVLTLEVRLLIYMRTMQLEKRVLNAIKGKPWGDRQELAAIWQRVDRRHTNGGEQRSCREAYLEFGEVMTIGYVLNLLHLGNDELNLLCAARNFACHVAIIAPDHILDPENIPAAVERCVNLVERLFGKAAQDT